MTLSSRLMLEFFYEILRTCLLSIPRGHHFCSPASRRAKEQEVPSVLLLNGNIVIA